MQTKAARVASAAVTIYSLNIFTKTKYLLSDTTPRPIHNDQPVQQSMYRQALIIPSRDFSLQ